MVHACANCDAEFETAAGLTQHLPLHHTTCGVCNDQFDDTDSLRDHVHTSH